MHAGVTAVEKALAEAELLLGPPRSFMTPSSTRSRVRSNRL